MKNTMYQIMESMRRNLWAVYWSTQKGKYCGEKITANCKYCRHYTAICKENEKLINLIKEVEKDSQKVA